MKLQLKKYGELDFTRFIDYDVTFKKEKETNTWSAVKIIDDTEIDFHFDELMFKNCKTNEIKIDWDTIKSHLDLVDDNINIIKTKSLEILNPLYLSVFNKTIDSVDGMFVLDELEIVGLTSVVSQKFDEIIGSGIKFKLGFYLECKTNEMVLLDPYFKYYTYFTSNLDLSGAFRG
ncbi:hypothetical protein [Tenacibaculum sp. M341]|uniref:hypothetical protein n=1 Tax=Tenacibaculum sp. M341 TaxID=2530339 RepID=UPI0010516FC6|nr:hypothetical protein [Tenacibaculum sp. M341]TCI93632.1 hypothetical protein EYW44_04260 [Tenacibaculum sp. M341]